MGVGEDSYVDSVSILICDKSTCRAEGEYMPMDFTEIDRFGCRSFGPTPIRLFDVGAQHDCVRRNLEVPMDQMNPKLCVGIITDEKLGKVLNVCLVYFWLLGTIQEFIVPVKL